MSSEDKGPTMRKQTTEKSDGEKESQSTMATSPASDSRLLGGLLDKIDTRWKNWFIRGVFSIIMISFFSIITYLGPFVLSLLVIGILLKCFQEVISIGYTKGKEYNIPLFRALNWYFLAVATYFLYGDNLFYYYQESIPGLVVWLAHYHRIISFMMYITGFVMFVLTLKKEHYHTQFSMFGWTHLTLFMLGSQAYLLIQNVLGELYWFILPVSLVICNDIMAYLFGFFFGRTSLIKLSPKKTWEGFLGAFASTVVFAFIFSYVLAQFDYFVCTSGESTCIRGPLYTLTDYHIGSTHIHLYPAQLHSIPFAVFASLIAPFGGFFASGLKRAFQIKDFADVIPGHGGIMDRFDCQILMATFSNVYYFTFLRTPHPEQLLATFFALPSDQQLFLYRKLEEKLLSRGQLAG
ncbi:hypothetical protein EMCRGX_G022669 [Ephydatia muelleri]